MVTARSHPGKQQELLSVSVSDSSEAFHIVRQAISVCARVNDLMHYVINRGVNREYYDKSPDVLRNA